MNIFLCYTRLLIWYPSTIELVFS